MRVVGETRQNLTCAICGDKADGQHFGADACRACAAFFRRTIAGKLKYVCRFEDGCEINKSTFLKLFLQNSIFVLFVTLFVTT